MAQKIYTKKFGEIEVERSWTDGPHHIAKLTNGAYCHITGLPIYNKSELAAVLTGADLEDALNWFDHRHEAEEGPPRRIMFEADGTPVFEDGSPVENSADLIQSLKPGPVLDAALQAFYKKQEAKKAAEKLAQTPAGDAAHRVAGKKSPPSEKSGMKKPAGKQGKPAAVHQKATPPPPAQKPAQITV